MAHGRTSRHSFSLSESEQPEALATALRKTLRPHINTRRSSDEEEHKATWQELFYDLIYVGAFVNLGVLLKHDVSAEGVFTFFLYYTIFWWTWHVSHFYFARYKTHDRTTELIFWGHMCGVMMMAVHVQEGFHNRRAFAFGYMFAHGCLFLLYLCVLIFLEPVPDDERNLGSEDGTFHSTDRAPQQAGPSTDPAKKLQLLKISTGLLMVVMLFGIALFFGSTFTISTRACIALWVLSVVYEMMCLSFVSLFNGRNKLTHIHVNHTAERQGLYLMLTLGESILSLISGKIEGSTEYYVFLAAAFALTFNIQLNYFDLQPFDSESHALNRSAFHGRVALYLHLFLSACVLMVGISIKIGLVYIGTDYHRSYAWLFAASLALTYVIMHLIRLCHKKPPECTNVRVRSVFLHGFRFLIPLIIILLPLRKSWNVTAFTLCLWILTLFHVFLDNYGHTLHRKFLKRKNKAHLQAWAALQGEFKSINWNILALPVEGQRRDARPFDGTLRPAFEKMSIEDVAEYVLKHMRDVGRYSDFMQAKTMIAIGKWQVTGHELIKAPLERWKVCFGDELAHELWDRTHAIRSQSLEWDRDPQVEF